MNEKKTALEILKERSHAIEYHTKNTDSFTLEMQIVSAMQEYLAQETAALREENERLKEAILKEIEVMYWEAAHDTSITLSQSDAARKWIMLVKKRIEKLKS